MAVSVDVITGSLRTTTTTPWTFTHAAGANPEAVILAMVKSQNTTDVVSAVTYGGVAMTRVRTETQPNVAGELGRVYIYELLSGVPSGSQTVSITVPGGNDDDFDIVCVTLQAGAAVERIDDDGLSTQLSANPSLTLSAGGRTNYGVGAIISGVNAPGSATPVAGTTTVQSSDFGSSSGLAFRRSAIAGVDWTCGYTIASNTWAMAAAIYAEVVAGGTNHSLPLSDSVTVTDAISKRPGLGKADTATSSDAIGKASALSKADSVTATDLIAKAVGKALADSVTPTDNATVLKIIALLLSDTVTVTDSITKTVGLGKADQVTATDALTRAWAALRSFGDTATATDAISKRAGLGKADSVTPSDSIAKRAALAKADSVTVTDAVAKALAKAVTDSVTATDLLSKAYGLSKADTVTITDAVAKAVGKASADQVTVTDLIDVDLTPGGGGPTNHTLSLSDTVLVLDDIARSLNGEFLGQGESTPGKTILLNKFGIY